LDPVPTDHRNWHRLDWSDAAPAGTMSHHSEIDSALDAKDHLGPAATPDF
jgi:hypothetical protein